MKKTLLLYILIIAMVLTSVPVFADTDNSSKAAVTTQTTETKASDSTDNSKSTTDTADTSKNTSDTANTNKDSSDTTDADNSASDTADTSKNTDTTDTDKDSATAQTTSGSATQTTTKKTTTKKTTTKKTTTKTTKTTTTTTTKPDNKVTFQSRTTSEAAIEDAEKAAADEAKRLASQHQAVDNVKLEAGTALLIDETTGEILYCKDPDTRINPGSAVRMLTAILAIDNLNLDDYVIITQEDLPTPEPVVETKKTKKKTKKVEEPVVTNDLQVDELITIRDLISMMIIGEDNTAADILARYVGGTVEGFAELMNELADYLGCTSSHFTNPDGTYDANQYSCASDLALIAEYCTSSEDFVSIVNQSTFEMTESDLNKARSYTNSNRLLYDTSDEHKVTVGGISYTCKYEDCSGIITGYSATYGGILLTSASRGNTTLLCIVANTSDSGRFADSIQLLDWGFANYQTVKLLPSYFITDDIAVKGGQVESAALEVYADEYITIEANSDDIYLSSVFYLDDYVQAPCTAGAIVGFVKLYNNASAVAEYDVYLAEDVEASDDFLTRYGLSGVSLTRIIITILAAILILAGIIVSIVAIARNNRIHRKAVKAIRRRHAQLTEELFAEQMELNKQNMKENRKYWYSDEVADEIADTYDQVSAQQEESGLKKLSRKRAAKKAAKKAAAEMAASMNPTMKGGNSQAQTNPTNSQDGEQPKEESLTEKLQKNFFDYTE